MKKPVTVVLVCLGLGLLLISAFWPKLATGESHWGEEQQADFAEALKHAHQLELRQTAGNRQTAANQEEQRKELAAAQEHWKSQQDKLQQAKEARDRPGAVCFWTGLILTLAGVLAYRAL